MILSFTVVNVTTIWLERTNCYVLCLYISAVFASQRFISGFRGRVNFGKFIVIIFFFCFVVRCDFFSLMSSFFLLCYIMVILSRIRNLDYFGIDVSEMS